MLRTSEFRGLVNLNYTFGKWVAGISYDLAFSRFLKNQIPATATSTELVQARNSSLQLSLRYILWDGRKRK